MAFFADIPVGIVTKIEVRSSYTVAHIKTYSDIFHPKTFFLINDTNATLAQGFDSNDTRLNPPCPKIAYQDHNQSQENNETNITVIEHNQTLPIISSIPARIDQTQEEVIEPETPVEKEVVAKPKKVKKRKKPKKNKPKASSLDLF